MRAMYKNELADKMGVSRSTMRAYMKQVEDDASGKAIRVRIRFGRKATTERGHKATTGGKEKTRLGVEALLNIG